MPCDVSAWARRKKWLREIDHPGQDAAATGFFNATGQISKDHFQVFPQAQANPVLNFLNDGLLYTMEDPIELGETCRLRTFYGNFAPGFDLVGFIFYFGSPYALPIGGAEYTVRLLMQLTVVFTGLTFAVYQSEFFSLGGAAFSSYSFPSMTRILGLELPGGDPTGFSLVTPLDRCHNCTSGP